jgi:hypothetical protein
MPRKSCIGILPTDPGATSMIKQISLLCALAIAAAACSDATAVDQFDGPPAFSAVPNMVLCHLLQSGEYEPRSVNLNAVDGHRMHGDMLPGERVPGMPGYVFSAGCSVMRLHRLTTGTWTGTYEWACGGGSGSSPISFSLVQEYGMISGTVSYLGGTAAILWGVRRNEEGDIDPTGMRVNLVTDAAEGHFVHNIFRGQLSPYHESIEGVTDNGDSPGAGFGCSVSPGYAGTFTVTRVP